MTDAVIIDAVRTPVGKYGGALKDIRPDDLAAWVIAGLMTRNPKLDPAQIDDVLMGCANQAGEDNRNVARMAVLLAGLPVTVPAGTVNRLCGSGLMAVNQAAHAILSGQAEVVIAGGVESMSRAPFVMPKADSAFSRKAEIFDTTLGWRFVNAKLSELYHPYSMGETAENIAQQYKITREAQDAFALESQQKAAAAMQAGRFEDEIIPVPLPQKRGEEVLFDKDEFPKPETTLETLASLKPAFKDNGTVTAGNSSGLNDGASAVLIMSSEKAKALGLLPKARIISTAVAGVDPACMGMGPVPATNKALKLAGLSLSQIGLVELNEAFAAQSLACIQELGLNADRVNINGGAIALGHALGSSGSRILTTLLYEMQRQSTGRYGLATMCIGVGQGIATMIEKI